jgi:response regulator RpfG family c-di-GMP phosphodiesterase
MRDRVLIVDDSHDNIRILVALLRDKYELETAVSGEECLSKILGFGPELVLLDIMMPGLDGYEVCRRIKDSPLGGFTQVILISGRASPAERLKGYDAGADDYLVKPFDHDELVAKVRAHFRLRKTMKSLWDANSQIQKFNQELEMLVAERTREVVATRDIAIFALAKLADSRDAETGDHLERMRNYSRILADQLRLVGPYRDMIDAEFVDDIYRFSPLHDIGKVGIPDAILLKPGRLTAEEFDIMKTHSDIGADALQEALEHSDSGGFLAMATVIARHHHERFDGRGYPAGLAGPDIPLPARIVALADVYDAITSARVYKPALEPKTAKRMIEEESGTHFDPAIVDAFLQREDELIKFIGFGTRHHANEIETLLLVEACR